MAGRVSTTQALTYVDVLKDGLVRNVEVISTSVYTALVSIVVLVSTLQVLMSVNALRAGQEKIVKEVRLAVFYFMYSKYKNLYFYTFSFVKQKAFLCDTLRA